ncbi:hypothetical protein KR093_011646 [Drosophila rubida]|uniref:Very-long-chain (3R)-3-hydroxyacyl-CoA dehydratase n=1 Tax=Drosophila rubida TaxID=30044 RepID=A0AAD4PPF7_9MUSC|nr:hypothetical protein KR093_011646 [Drosophila rubida]
MSAKAAAKSSGKESSTLTKIYLFSYNAVQVGGWSYILYQLIDYYVLRSPEFRAEVTLWDFTRLAVIIFQNAAAVEVLNSVFGLVKSNPTVTLLQVFSRMMLVVGVVMATPTGKLSPGLPIALFAWCFTEIIRYGFYALNIIKFVPYFVLYLRYTTFIALYPIGVTGEMLCFWWAQRYARDHSVWSLEMPNKLNATFSYYIFLWIIMIGYIPVFPHLFFHMWTLRRKILGGGSKKKAN